MFSGQASGENAKAVGLLAEFMALTGWSFASGEQKPSGFDKPLGGKRMYSTSTTMHAQGLFLLITWMNEIDLSIVVLFCW